MNTSSRIIVFAFVMLADVLLSTSFAQKKFELSDLSKVTGLSDPQISPDGKKIVLITSRPDYEANRFNTEFVLIDITTSKNRSLTNNRLNVSQPRWSPSGEELAFLARTGVAKDAKIQLYVLPMNGGDAKQITNVPAGVQHYAWSPNGDVIAFATADEGTDKNKVEKGYDAFEIGNNDMYLTTSRTSSHIWLIPSNGGEPKRLTSGNWSLPVTIPPGAPSSPLSWSPDGKRIAFAKVSSSYSGDSYKRSIHLLNVEDGTITQLTARTELENIPSFSPDGTLISYLHYRNGQFGSLNDLWVTPSNTGTGKNLSIGHDREIDRAIWFPDNKNLLIGGHDDNRKALWVQPIQGNPKKIDLGTLSPTGQFWFEGSIGKDGSIAFIATDAKTPAELYYLNKVGSAPKRLTHFNNDLSKLTLGKTETLRWERDGFNHNGIVTYPPGYKKGNKYPLVLIIHGGPSFASLEVFNVRAQLFANTGYIVFEPNFRGSDHMGNDYKIANLGDFGAGPGEDIMAGVTKLISSGVVDSSRMAVTGWSYGGYMTAWLAGKYNVWRAAVAGAPVTDLVDQYTLSDGNILWGLRFGSPYKDERTYKSYIDQSPITFSHNIKAPTLILANVLDPRVPSTQAYKLYHALVDNGVETKFIGWPVPLHNANDPVRQREVTRVWMEWVEKYLGN